MAKVGVWSLSEKLRNAVEYDENPEKTYLDNNAENIKNIPDLSAQPVSEEYEKRTIFVSGINCQPEFAYEQMNETKKFFNQKDGRLAYHAYQSFAPGEITPWKAHEVGMEFAKKMWGDKYEVVVSTHLNTNCIHNHFLINSVSFLDGSKYQLPKHGLEHIRKVSDDICRKHNLSVIENPRTSVFKNYMEVIDDKTQPLSINNIIKKDIDECIFISVTQDEFFDNMEARGYTFDFSHKYAYIMNEEMDKKRRLSDLGYDYSPSAIAERINGNWGINSLDIPEQDDLAEDVIKDYDEESYQNIYKNFVSIVIAIKERPEKNRKYQKQYYEDIRERNMNRLSEQKNFLYDNDIDSSEDLEKFRQTAEDKMNSMLQKRHELRNAKSRIVRAGETDEGEKIKTEISGLTGKLKKIRRDLFLCEKIKNSIPRMKEKISEIKNVDERKEINRDGNFRRRSGKDRQNES